MQPTNKAVCPECGREIELKTKADNPARLVGECGCGTSNVRPVIETDADTPEQEAAALYSKKQSSRNKE